MPRRKRVRMPARAEEVDQLRRKNWENLLTAERLRDHGKRVGAVAQASRTLIELDRLDEVSAQEAAREYEEASERLSIGVSQHLGPFFPGVEDAVELARLAAARLMAGGKG